MARTRVVGAVLLVLAAGCSSGQPAADGTESNTQVDTSATFCDAVGSSSWGEVLGDLAILGDVDDGAQAAGDADICTRPSTSDEDTVDRGVSVVHDTSGDAGTVEDVRSFLDSSRAAYRDVAVEGASDALVSDALSGGFPVLVADVGDGLVTIRNDASTIGQETISEDLGNAFVELAERFVIPGVT